MLRNKHFDVENIIVLLQKLSRNGGEGRKHDRFNFISSGSFIGREPSMDYRHPIINEAWYDMKKLFWDYDCWISQGDFFGFSGATTIYEDEYERDKKLVLDSLAATSTPPKSSPP